MTDRLNFQDAGAGVKIVEQTDEFTKVAGYGVVFGGQDLTEEYFTKETDFKLGLVPVKLVLYDHNFDVIKSAIGETTLVDVDDYGVWVEAQLARSQAYVGMVEQLLERGVLGWSSGTAGHLARRNGKAIVEWPIIEFSLTPTPAEPRTLGVEVIKTLVKEGANGLEALIEGLQADGGTRTGRTKSKPNGGAKMPDNQIPDAGANTGFVTLTWAEVKDLLAQKGERAPETEPGTSEKINALSTQVNQILEAMKALPSAKDGGFIAPDSEEDHPETKSLGDFLVAVANKNHKRLTAVYKAVQDTKAALAEEAGATGGYLVPEQLAAPIFAASENFSVLRSLPATTIMPMYSRSMKIPKLNIETAPSAGNTAYAGGVVAAWEAEAGALDETEPNFKQMELVAHKLGGYTLASNELIEDSPQALEKLLVTLFGRAVGSKENYAFFRGTGAGQPKGILESGALVSATRSAASAVALADLAKMMANFLPDSWQTGAWVINPAVIEKIIQLVSNPLTWMNDLRTGMPVSLLGLPMKVSGALPGLNTAGDILLIDPSYYVIGDRRALSIAFSEHYKFINDQGTWRFTHRVDGQPWIDGTITLENASTVVTPFVALAAG